MIKLGYAETDITPDIPLQLVGFNREDNTSGGILKPLLAQVSIWESEKRQCLITVDSIGFKKELADRLRTRVGDMLNVSCSQVMLCFSHCHSAPDYFGNIRELLQEKYGCPVMVIQGSAGNIAPKYFDSMETPVDARGSQYVRSNTALEDMAAVVCEKLSQRIASIDVADTLPITMYSKEMLFHADIPSLTAAEKIAEEAQKYCGIDGTAWLAEIRRLHNAGVSRQKETIEVQYFAIGKWCICGVPYELMVEFALESMERLKNPFFYVNGYTNGCLSYFPTEEEYDKGGYEVYWSMLIYYKYFNRVFPFERDAAGKLIEFILKNAPI